MGKGLSKRKVKVSSQMQVRIPADMFHAYGFGGEAMCVATATGVEFRPVKDTAEMHADLLEDLLAQGLSGDELAARFRERLAAGDQVEYASFDFKGRL